MSVWDELTPLQIEAVHATADRFLRIPVSLAEELLPLLRASTTPPEPATRFAVNDPLTPETQEIPRA